MFNSSNPTINKLSGFGGNSANPSSYLGVSLKTMYFALVVILGAIFAITFLPALVVGNSTFLTIILIVAPLAAFVFAMLANRPSKATPIWGTLYALCEGMVLGLVSLMFESLYQGIVLVALLSTVVVLLVMMLLYSTGIIRVGAKFTRIVLTSLISVVVAQLLFFIISIFVPSLSAMYYTSFWLQIGVSSLMIVLASAMLLIDLDRITTVVNQGMGKQYEWTAALGLIITLVWLYLQILRFLSIILSRKK